MNTTNPCYVRTMLLVLLLVMGGLSAMAVRTDDYPWRVKVLDDSTAGTGLIKGGGCLFTIPNYWPYGHFEPQGRCELPGKLFRAKASGGQAVPG